MDLSEVKKTPLSRKRRMRVGRGCGSGKGCTSGKGNKGQNSRSGAKAPRSFEGGTMPLYRRIPKRGFNNTRFQKDWIAINVDQLNAFDAGDEVNAETLMKADLLGSCRSYKNLCVKLLGRGDLEVENLKIKVHKISQSAKEKVEKAKGTLELIELEPRKKLKKKPRRNNS